MKRFVAILLTVSMLLMLAVPVSAADADIIDTATGAGSFTVLLTALDKAELTETLRGDGPFTVFAPTDAAFTTLLGELGITADDLLNHPDLAKVLLYHVVSGKVMSTDLTDGLEAPTVLGETVRADLSAGVKINDANVVAADVDTTNGVIHVIDTVLVPEGFALVETAEETVIPKTDDQTILYSGLLIMAGLAGMAMTLGYSLRRKAARVPEDR